MKRYVLSLLACLCGLIALAQTDEPAMRREFDDAFMHPEADSLAADKQRKAPRYMSLSSYSLSFFKPFMTVDFI